jgi:hypothetical protein
LSHSLIIFSLSAAKPSANKVASKFLHKICKAPVFDPPSLTKL